MTAEEERMDDALWQAFLDTGDPLCWLVHKAAERKNNKEGDKDKSYPLG